VPSRSGYPKQDEQLYRGSRRDDDLSTLPRSRRRRHSLKVPPCFRPRVHLDLPRWIRQPESSLFSLPVLYRPAALKLINSFRSCRRLPAPSATAPSPSTAMRKPSSKTLRRSRSPSKVSSVDSTFLYVLFLAYSFYLSRYQDVLETTLTRSDPFLAACLPRSGMEILDQARSSR
jgi:hypothetical protein